MIGGFLTKHQAFKPLRRGEIGGLFCEKTGEDLKGLGRGDPSSLSKDAVEGEGPFWKVLFGGCGEGLLFEFP